MYAIPDDTHQPGGRLAGHRALCAFLVGLLGVVFGLAACGGNEGSPNVEPSHRIGGTVSGLGAGQQVILRLGHDHAVVSSDGPFTFSVALSEGTEYRVAVDTPATNRRCQVSSGRGVVASSDVTNVKVDCSEEVAWVTDGQVNTSVSSPNGKDLFVGGWFTRIGPATGAIALINGTTGDASPTFPKFDGSVTSAIPDGDGGWYVAGKFEHVDGKPASKLVHILDDHLPDERFRPEPDSDVHALAMAGGRLFVGGEFQRIGGAARSHLAALNPITGADTDWEGPALDGAVLQLAAGDNALYAAGTFGLASHQVRAGLAGLDIATGRLLPWDAGLPSGPPPSLTSLAFYRGRVYVAGNFSQIGSAERDGLASLDPITGKAADWNPRCEGTVRAMAFADHRVYLVGDDLYVCRRDADELIADTVVAIDIETAAATAIGITPVPEITYPDEGGVPFSADTIAIQGNRLYLGGRFNYPDRGLLAYSLATGKALAWVDGGTSGQVGFLVSSGEYVLAGGNIGMIGGVPRDGLAAVDKETGRATDWKPSLSIHQFSWDRYVHVEHLVVDGSRLLVAGRFDTADDGEDRLGLAAYDLADGKLTSWNPDAVVYESAQRLGTAGGVIYALTDGGVFALDGMTGSPLDWPPENLYIGSNGAQEMVVTGDLLILAGSGTFLVTNGDDYWVERPSFLALDRATGRAASWSPQFTRLDGTYGEISALHRDGSTLYVGGEFSVVDSLLTTNLVALDLDNLSVVPSWLSQLTDRQAVMSIGRVSGAGPVYAGSPGSVEAIAPLTGSPLDWKAIFAGTALTLTADDEQLHIGGSFGAINGTVAPNLAHLRPTLAGGGQ